MNEGVINDYDLCQQFTADHLSIYLNYIFCYNCDHLGCSIYFLIFSLLDRYFFSVFAFIKTTVETGYNRDGWTRAKVLL